MPFHLPSSKSSVASIFAFVQFRTESGQRLGPSSHTSFSIPVSTEPQWVFGKWGQPVTHQQDHTSISPGPGQSRCSSACAPRHDACGRSGSHHRWCHPQCTGLGERVQSSSATRLSIKTEPFCLGHHFLCLITTQADHDKLHSSRKEPSCNLWRSQCCTHPPAPEFIYQQCANKQRLQKRGLQGTIQLQNCLVVALDRFHVWTKV